MPLTPKHKRIVFYVSTVLVSIIMLISAGMYFFINGQVQAEFTKLGYPTYLIYPMAIAKLLGLVAIWVSGFPNLKNWAYAGFFFNALLALNAQIHVQNGDILPALAASFLILVSYCTNESLHPNS